MVVVKNMYSILKNSVSHYEIKRSKFITFLYKINNVHEIERYLFEIRQQYPGATHYCFAYILENEYRFSDDGEPSGTAGLPMMEILRKKELHNVLCVVVRYFGGIKLGAGGLTRTYSKCVREALNENSIIQLVDGYLIEVNVAYEENKKFEYLIRECEIVEKAFQDSIQYILKINKDFYCTLEKYQPRIIESILIKKNN